MNFLSHYYFDQHVNNHNIIFGALLPDLLKNASGKLHPHPEKNEEIFKEDESCYAILKGWKRHLQVDKIFHSSIFFETHTQQLKTKLAPILIGTPVRPSFLAHIGLELLLDHLLLTNHKIKVDELYNNLQLVKDEDIVLFLQKCGITDVTVFAHFFKNFKSSKYLISYQKIENISYALQRICMRLWPTPFNDEVRDEITLVLAQYLLALEVDFMVIFDEIDKQLA